MAQQDEDRRRYKGKYNRFSMKPAKISTSGFVRLYILYMLTQNSEMYGLEMIDEMAGSFAKVSRWEPSSSIVYPLLKRMSNQGYLKSYKEDPEVNSRKYYKLTSEGYHFFKEKKKEYKEIFDEAIAMLQFVREEMFDEDE